MTDGLRRWPPAAFLAGAVALGVCVIGALSMQDGAAHFFRAWLVAFDIFTGAAVGSLVVLMVQYLFGATWGLALRPTLESATRTLPLMAVLFVPLIFGTDYVFPWARYESVMRDHSLKERPLYEKTPEHDHELDHKYPYLNRAWWVVRGVIVFAVWITLSRLLCRWSRSKEKDATVWCESLSAPGLVVFMATVTLASIDWGMSLEPRWYSTIYGAYFGMGQVLTGYSICLAVLLMLARRPEVGRVVAGQTMSDMGTVLMAFLMIWAYLAFMQLLIIWMGHLPEELTWYEPRLVDPAWRPVAVSLLVVHFAIPFALLMSFAVKRDRQSLLTITLLVCVMRVVEVFWLLIPAFSRDNSGIEPAAPAAFVLYPAAVVAVGGLWLGMFLWQLGRQPALTEEAAHGEASH
jgi:hypothetical protein